MPRGTGARDGMAGGEAVSGRFFARAVRGVGADVMTVGLLVAIGVGYVCAITVAPAWGPNWSVAWGAAQAACYFWVVVSWAGRQFWKGRRR